MDPWYHTIGDGRMRYMTTLRPHNPRGFPDHKNKALGTKKLHATSDVCTNQIVPRF